MVDGNLMTKYVECQERKEKGKMAYGAVEPILV